MSSVEFDPASFDDLAWWAEQDRAQAASIIRLVQDTQHGPFYGIGKRVVDCSGRSALGSDMR